LSAASNHLFCHSAHCLAVKSNSALAAGLLSRYARMSGDNSPYVKIPGVSSTGVLPVFDGHTKVFSPFASTA
jgi:hypothetical protein